MWSARSSHNPRVLLFKKPFWAGLIGGTITITFRRWEKAHVKVGGRYRCHPIGVLEVESVERVRLSDISEVDARRAGFEDRAALLAHLEGDGRGALDGETEIWRVALHHGGDGDRVPLALDESLGAAEVKAIGAKLRAMDERSNLGPWTKKALTLIEENPRVAASKLAARIKWETAPFKANVVKLKKLGLTQSFEVGYELSPRGRAFRAAAGKKRKATIKR